MRSPKSEDRPTGKGERPIRRPTVGDSVIRSDGSVLWFAEPSSTAGELDEDIFNAYRDWYEAQVKEENEHDCIPLQLAS